MRQILINFCAIVLCCFNDFSYANDGYDLWLKYSQPPKPYAKAMLKQYKGLVARCDTPTKQAACQELQRGLLGLTGAPLATKTKLGKNTLVLATLDELADLKLTLPTAALESLGPEGYWVGTPHSSKRSITLITAHSDIGLLYGSFALLQYLQQQKPIDALALSSSPRVQLRILNHWDNLDGTVERGYSGASLWDWWRLPDLVDTRYTDYARANAAVGINGTVLNNVNSKALSLSPRYIKKAAAVANVLRPYGIQVYLSARFNAPMELGGLPTADPLDPKVQKWWRQKTNDIYAMIPDFGGFLVKANSEGQPGPQDYGRTHADGANMLAKALEPHDGVVMWRAFVYSEHDAEDRARQAYSEFQPLDGQFADNVLIQVKNGPIDFQPREPFHPMFGAMPHTPLMLELQITKEYLGFSTHLAYLGTLWEELLQTDTHVSTKSPSTVADVVDGQLHQSSITGMAGVANIGRDRNWSGSIFDQANWYAFARLAWDPNTSARAIAKDWLALTFTPDPGFVNGALSIMMRSREAVVNYMTPLGLAHQMATGHHYGPGPWVDDLARPEWNPAYYHRADKNGIGFDRTASGSNALAQYAPTAAKQWANPKTIEDRYLLWFHHVPWQFSMRSGRTLWQELVYRYDLGVREVEQMAADWSALKPYVDNARYEDISARLKIQTREARWWRDASLAYFGSVSGLPLPEGVRKPEHPLEYYKALSFPFAPSD